MMDVYSKLDLSGMAHERRPSWQRGQTLVLVALFIVIFFGFLALVIDLGNIYSQRRFMQNAADAGALAGARALALGQPNSEIVAEANRYGVKLNRAQSCATQVLTSTVVVTAQKTFPTYFASVIGIPQFTVSAVAVAGFDPPKSQGDLMPMVIRESVMKWAKEKDEIEIWDDAKDNSGKDISSDPSLNRIADGDRGWVDYTGFTADVLPNGKNQKLQYWIQNGCKCTVAVSDTVPAFEGVVASIVDNFKSRYLESVLIPIFDDDPDAVAKQQYTIVGFALFEVTGYKDTGVPKYVKGKFIKMVTTEEAGFGPEFGVRVVRLKR